MIQAENAGGGRQLGLVDGDPGEPDPGGAEKAAPSGMVHQQTPAGAEVEGVVAVEQEAALVGDLGERQAVDGVEIFEPASPTSRVSPRLVPTQSCPCRSC